MADLSLQSWVLYANGDQGSNHIFGKVVLTEKAHEIDANYTLVGWEYWMWNTGEWLTFDQKNALKILLDNTEAINTSNVGTVRLPPTTESTAIRIASGEMPVYHESDGTKTISVSLDSRNTWSEAYILTGELSVEMTVIPRVTVPVLSVESAVLGDTITVSFPRASDTFKHSLSYRLNDYHENIVERAETEVTYTLPYDLASQLPNSTSGTITFYCYTWASENDCIGSTTVTLPVSVPESFAPTIASASITEASDEVKGSFDSFVMRKSWLDVALEVSTMYGASVAQIETTIQGVTYSGLNFTSSVLEKSGTSDIVIKATDSRGRIGTATVPLTVLYYTQPIITKLDAYRANSAGTADEEGLYLAVDFSFIVETVNNQNEKEWILEYKLQTDSAWTTLESGNDYSLEKVTVTASEVLTEDDEYDVRLTVTDSFRSVSASDEVPSSFTLMDFHHSGKGMSIGEVCINPGFWVAMETTFKKMTSFRMQEAVTDFFTHEIVDFQDKSGNIVAKLMSDPENPEDGLALMTVDSDGNTLSMTQLSPSGNVTMTGQIVLNAELTLTLYNSWRQYSSFKTASYYKDKFGIVHLSGVICGGTITYGTQISLLPAGYRPAAAEIFPVSTEGDYNGKIGIGPDGNVYVHTLANNSFVSFSGISFRAAQ
ncbi:MAG: hypothetical protein IJ468_14960 [Lachnospiraceae bacterium]|nr:hypothetical protein [Lachnospiraceae bacterium]